MTAAFAGSTLITLLLLALTLSQHRCNGSDAAGCGMETGLLTIGVYGASILVGLLVLLYCVRVRAVKLIAFGLLLVIAVPAAIHLIFLVADNFGRTRLPI